MITLSNGDKWRLLTMDDPSLQTPGSHLPENTASTSFEEFVDALRLDMDERKSSNSLYPARWNSRNKLWEIAASQQEVNDCLMLIATKAGILPFGAHVFVMPWGKVYVVYEGTDSGGYDACDFMTHFDSWDDYVATVTNIAELPQDQEGDLDE